MGWGSSVFPLLIVTSSGGFTGLFVYTPAPASRRMLASVTAQNGTDPYTNAYLAGVTSYQVGGAPVVAVQLNQGQITFWSAPTEAGPWTFTGQIGVGTGNILTFTPGGGGKVSVQSYLDSFGLQVAEGVNAKQGVATLAAGTVTVANTTVSATSRIFLTAQDNSSTGALRVSARVVGTSFTITSSNAADTGVVAWEMFEVG